MKVLCGPPQGVPAGTGGKAGACGLGRRGQMCLGMPARCRGYCGTPISLISVLLDLNKISLCVGCVCHLKDEVGEACLKDGKPNEPFFPCKL